MYLYIHKKYGNKENSEVCLIATNIQRWLLKGSNCSVKQSGRPVTVGSEVRAQPHIV